MRSFSDLQVSSSPASLQLLSILQTLLVLGPSRSDIWLALEAITNRAILLAQDCESAPKQHTHREEANGQLMAASVINV